MSCVVWLQLNRYLHNYVSYVPEGIFDSMNPNKNKLKLILKNKILNILILWTIKYHKSDSRFKSMSNEQIMTI